MTKEVVKLIELDRAFSKLLEMPIDDYFLVLLKNEHERALMKDLEALKFVTEMPYPKSKYKMYKLQNRGIQSAEIGGIIKFYEEQSRLKKEEDERKASMPKIEVIQETIVTENFSNDTGYTTYYVVFGLVMFLLLIYLLIKN